MVRVPPSCSFWSTSSSLFSLFLPTLSLAKLLNRHTDTLLSCSPPLHRIG
ncbi:unnamed protein product [Phytomonas sp. Hart1]|nr:unnamed protein product [Phytomonas sp. Hart1]|eukprot:CCW71272.1 unnamed protein product [Phytomonas sp. isolate Hart1]